MTDQVTPEDSDLIPLGFTRPNKVNFPAFTFQNELELKINCQILICLNDSPDCNIDFTNCLQLNNLGRRRRRSIDNKDEGQTVKI